MKSTDTNFVLDVSGSYVSETTPLLSGFTPVSGASHITSGQGMAPTSILFQFDRGLLSGTVSISSIIFREAGSATNLSGTVEVSGSNCTFIAASGIMTTASGSYHPIVLGSGSAVGVKDLAGNFVATISGAFVTQNILLLSGWVPVSGATSVFSGLGTPQLRVLAQFDRDLLSGTANISSFLLRASGASTNLSGAIEVSGNNMTFVLASGQITTTSAHYHPIVIGSGNAVGLKDLQGMFTSTVSGMFITTTEPII